MSSNNNKLDSIMDSNLGMCIGIGATALSGFGVVYALSKLVKKMNRRKPTNIKLTYFDIEGAAEPVRLALALSGTEFQDERIDRAKWDDLKPHMPYKQLPVMTMTVGDDKNVRDRLYTQSGAMLRWVGADLSDTLYPRDRMYDIEEAIGLADDLKRSWTPNLYIGMRPEAYGHSPEYAKTDEGKKCIKELRKQWVQNELPVYVGYIKDMIARRGGKWLAGPDVTIADCYMVPILRSFTRGYIDHVPADCFDNDPEIIDYIKRFCALDAVKGRYTKGVY